MPKCAKNATENTKEGRTSAKKAQQEPKGAKRILKKKCRICYPFKHLFGNIYKYCLSQ